MSHNFRTDTPGQPTRTQLRRMARRIKDNDQLRFLMSHLDEAEAAATVRRLRPYLNFIVTDRK